MYDVGVYGILAHFPKMVKSYHLITLCFKQSANLLTFHSLLFSYNWHISTYPISKFVLFMSVYLVFSKRCLVCTYVVYVLSCANPTAFALYTSYNVYFVWYMFTFFFPGVAMLSSLQYQALYDLSSVFYVFEPLDNG